MVNILASDSQEVYTWAFLGRFLISMTVMEVCQYGKTDIKFGFHRFWPFPNILVFMDLWKLSKVK
jgi:hypothetical protein